MSPSSVIESLEQRAYYSVTFGLSKFTVEDNATGVLFAPVIGDFDGDGKTDLIVADASSNGVAEGRYAFAKGDGAGNFSVRNSVAAGVFTFAAKAGDFNGDGKLDLVASNPGVSGGSAGNNILVSLGNGDGTFQAPLTFVVGTQPLSIAVGDFNGDHLADVAVGNRGSGNVSVLLGNSASTLVPGVTLPAGGDPASIVAADFNADSKVDLVVGNAAAGSAGLQTFLGNGDGTFAAAVVTSGPPGITGVGDFNGDAKADAAVSVADTGAASVVLGNGAGGFNATGTFPAAGFSALVADYDGDGRADIAVSGTTSGGATPVVQVLLGNGDGTFQQPLALNADTPGAGAVGDLNGDGKADLVFAGQTAAGARVVDVLLNQSTPGSGADLTGQFIGKIPTAVIGGAKGAATVRMTNSGNAVAAGSVTVTLFATGNGQADTQLTATAKPIKLKLKPNKSKNVKFKFTYPSNLPDGSYTLVAHLDSNNVIGEGSETNNAVTSSPITIAAPFVDLSGAYAKALPAALSAGQRVTVSVRVANNGNSTAAGPLTINVVARAGDATVADVALGTLSNKNIKLKNGKTATFKIKLLVPAGLTGARSVVTTINPAAAIPETNIANNDVTQDAAVTFS